MKSLHYQRYLQAHTGVEKDINAWFFQNHQAACAAGAVEVRSDDQTLFCAVEKQVWDSDVLGVATGRVVDVFVTDEAEVTLSSASDFAVRIDEAFRQLQVRLAVLRAGTVPKPLLYALKTKGWRIVDSLVIFNGPCTSRTSEVLPPAFHVKNVTPATAHIFFEQAGDLYAHSRIYQDIRITAKQARQFYTELHRAIWLKPSSVVLGLYSGDTIAGLVIGAKDEHLARGLALDLGYLWEIGVLPAFRNQGVANWLLPAFLNRCHSVFGNIEIGTQFNNIPSLRLYCRNHLTPVASALTLHRWLDEDY